MKVVGNVKHTQLSVYLHGDAPHVVLLIYPHEEGLLLVVEDAAAIGPVWGTHVEIIQLNDLK